MPIDKDVREERFVRLINKYNEKKGYRWEIQKTIISKAPLPRMDNGDIDQNAIETLIAQRLFSALLFENNLSVRALARPAPLARRA